MPVPLPVTSEYTELVKIAIFTNNKSLLWLDSLILKECAAIAKVEKRQTFCDFHQLRIAIAPYNEMPRLSEW